MKDALIALCNQFAVDHANIGIHAVDHMGKTIIYNRKMKEIEGLNFEEIKDRSILELFNFDKTESTLLKVLQSGQPELHIKQTYWNRKDMEITTMNDTYPVYENDQLLGAIEFAEDITALEKFVLQPLRKTRGPMTFSQIIAHSEAMKSVISTAEKAAHARLPVLLIGETGTGKDAIAECIHHASSSAQHFHTFHGLRATADSLAQLEKTMNEQSDATLFCERIDALSIDMQQSLLHVLQRLSVGQFLASIGEDPIELIASGALLKELYYFFASFTIRIPPLRKRPEDILPFAESYLNSRKETLGAALSTLSDETALLFQQYSWPGNVRELELLLDEVSSTWTNEEMIAPHMLPAQFRAKANPQADDAIQPSDFLVNAGSKLLPLDQYLREAESYYLQKATQMHDGNITKTAAALGMSRQNLQYRLRKLKE